MENYRPISVLSLVAMIMECIVFNQLYGFFSNTHYSHNSRLVSDLTTPLMQDILIKAVDDWRKSVADNDYIVGALFLDVSKAFEYSAAKLWNSLPPRRTLQAPWALIKHVRLHWIEVIQGCCFFTFLCCCLLSNPLLHCNAYVFCFIYQGLPENQLWSWGKNPVKISVSTLHTSLWWYGKPWPPVIWRNIIMKVSHCESHIPLYM